MKVSARKARVLALLLALLYMPLLWARPTPAWIDDPTLQYPPDRYLTGVGKGDNRAAAEDDAYAAIARIFSAQVSQRSAEWEKYLQSDTGKTSVERRDFMVEQTTTVTTRRIVAQVMIAASHYDRRAKRHYALAVMDRRQAAASLREQIDALERQADEALVSAQTGDKLARLRAWHRAEKALLGVEAHQAELQVVDPAGVAGADPARLIQLRQTLADFLSRDFQVRVQMDKAPEAVRAALLETLTRHGFRVAGQTPADLRINAEAGVQPLSLSTGEYARWQVQVEARDAGTGALIASLVRQGREGHNSASGAEARAWRAMQQALSGELGNDLVARIYGE